MPACSLLYHCSVPAQLCPSLGFMSYSDFLLNGFFNLTLNKAIVCVHHKDISYSLLIRVYLIFSCSYSLPQTHMHTPCRL